MTVTKPSASFLGPVDQLPAEGIDLPCAGKSEIDLCATMFANSDLWFEVTTDGATLVSNPQEVETFQLFDIGSDGEGGLAPVWSDCAYELSLSSLVGDAAAFGTLSDASEPEDFVRRFLEVLSSSTKGEFAKSGAALPLIRWSPGEDGNSARVQLLGLLLADDGQFEAFCRSNSGEFGFVFEDAEVQARGMREALTALALLGITLGSAGQAEAGIFKPPVKKNQRVQQVAFRKSVREAQAPIQKAQSGWQDVHRDAYVNQELLAAGKAGKKRIVVDVSKQRAYLLVDGVVAIDTAVSTARSGKYTPRGEFRITERVKTGKTSTIYGCSLPYWQRLDDSPIGLHVGDLPGYPASAGCIRLPESVAPILFEHTASGVSVEVVDAWGGPAPQAGAGMVVAQVVAQPIEG